MLTRRLLRLFAAVLLVTACAAAQELPTPEKYLGFRVGTDKKLARWDQVIEYMQMAAKASDRVRYTELGKSTMGHPFALMVISSPANLSRLSEIQANQCKLAYPGQLDEKAADEIIAKNPAVMLITLTIHSSEIGSTQMSLELVHRLATEKSAYIQNLLDNVVFLLAPSVNPDGQVMVVDWYNKNAGTEFENAPMPWLYHKYVGHDNNRDSYMLTQVETLHVAKILYQDWFPVAFLDEHQMGSNGPRIFVPPFEDPVNPNIDPAVIAASNLMGMYLFTGLNRAGLEGAQYGERFTWWWQGSHKNGAWYHNMAGLLTEVASARIASPIEQLRARLGQSRSAVEGFSEDAPGAQADPRRPLAPPTDTWPRTNYPRPWLGGTWTLRNIVDYELTITYALLEGVAANRAMLQKNFYSLNRKAIATGAQGDPFAYVFPPAQHDPGALWKLLEALDLSGIEIFRARAAFQAGGKDYPAGSYVIPMSQPFRNYVKDLLEPQQYPMKPTAPGQPPERPYDVTGWTLPLQMGVTAVKIDKPFQGQLERVSPIPLPEGKVISAAKAAKPRMITYLLPHEWNSSARAVNRLLKDESVEISWAAENFHAGDADHSAGTILVRAKAGKEVAAAIEKATKETNVAVTATDAAISVPAWKLRAPRIGLYQPWTANMDEGWTRWLLEQYDFPYTTLRNDDIRAGKLNEKFDVILFASQSRNSILNGARGAWVRPEHRGGLGEEGAKAVEEFVRGGGTLVALDDAADFAIEALGLPVKNTLRGVPADKFYCPGAVLQILVDNHHPVAYGMPAKTSAYFLDSPAFEITAPFSTAAARAVVKYPSVNPLQSGWIGGPEYLFDKVGVAEANVGKGRVVLLGFRAQFRAQPHATFKLLFNSLHWSAATLQGK
ncbi:MAG: hypothetical protein HY234_16005 [Acidobacteria bacterium]|nr:hypothetical protein [Acidobacteriota bacterium]MBI3664540.1 hypothetical protein [Acidobacteriota bacterium]